MMSSSCCPALARNVHSSRIMRQIGIFHFSYDMVLAHSTADLRRRERRATGRELVSLRSPARVPLNSRPVGLLDPSRRKE